jgi:hypothetical protein
MPIKKLNEIPSDILSALIRRAHKLYGPSYPVKGSYLKALSIPKKGVYRFRFRSVFTKGVKTIEINTKRGPNIGNVTEID